MNGEKKINQIDTEMMKNDFVHIGFQYICELIKSDFIHIGTEKDLFF